MSAVVIVNKPLGWTSFQVVRKLKRIFQEKKVGHLGTLDPMATGVLPIFLGKHTKLISLFDELDKTYRATIKLGETTDTFDAEGEVIQSLDPSGVTVDDVTRVVASYAGAQEQLAPIYSALKYNGVPGYQLARENKPVPRKKRTIEIHSIRVISMDLPQICIDVHCSKGTYIRSLADDIGRDLGVGAHLTALERLSCGSLFSIEDALSLEEIEQCRQNDSQWPGVSPLKVLRHLDTLCVTFDEQQAIGYGRAFSFGSDRLQAASRDPQDLKTPFVKAVNSDNELIAIGRVVMKSSQCFFNPTKNIMEGSAC